jgi:hypothetical protein
MTADSRLPSFVIIGAVKAATTWIHNQLQANPSIFLPGPEPHFFSQDHHRGVDHYRRLFRAARPEQILGEKSADYFAHSAAPARLARIMPDARLVLQLRNPVDRAYSDYKMLYRRGTVTGPPEAYLHSGATRYHRFLRDGLYAEHLGRWLDHFDREQMHVLLFEDVKSTPADVVARVCEHIGAPGHFSEEVGTAPRNDSSARFLPLPVRTALAPLKDVARPLRGKPVFEGVRRIFAREIQYPPLVDAMREQMVDYYAADIERLEVMIDRDLSHWRTSRRIAA